jgi:DNA polymerase delta subunit 3
MAGEQYKDYLAVRLLTEHKPVTYRLLSRACKTDVNTAKRFVQSMQELNTSSPYTGCFLSSTRSRMRESPTLCTPPTSLPAYHEDTNGVNGRIGEDTDMRGSPFMSSMPEPEESGDSDYTSESDDENTAAPKGVKETQIVLVREEELEGASVLDSYMCQPG